MLARTLYVGSQEAGLGKSEELSSHSGVGQIEFAGEIGCVDRAILAAVNGIRHLHAITVSEQELGPAADLFQGWVLLGIGSNLGNIFRKT